MIPRQSNVISYYIGIFLFRLLCRWKQIHLHFLSHGPLFAKKRNPSHSAHHLNIVTLSFPRPLSYIPFSLSSPPPFFTSSTPAVFHLNISSSCLAASTACQVSSRSQGPTLKWSTEVIFRGVCVRKRERQKEKRKGVGWEGEAARLGSETSGGDKKWKGGEDMGVITNVLPVYFLFSPVNPSCCWHPLSPSA